LDIRLLPKDPGVVTIVEERGFSRAWIRGKKRKRSTRTGIRGGKGNQSNYPLYRGAAFAKKNKRTTKRKESDLVIAHG